MCRGDPSYSRVTDEDMKVIMSAAVNQVYKLLYLRDHDPVAFERQVAFGERYTRTWDEPENVDRASW